MMRPCLGVGGRPCPRGALINGRRCEACRLEEGRRRNCQRDPVARRVYASAEWKELSRRVREEDGRVCRYCGGVGDTVDHIESIRRNPARALDRSNVVVACRSCQERRKTVGRGDLT
jgi:5-methylcytosine-specific restriction endonuclease McrA